MWIQIPTNQTGRQIIGGVSRLAALNRLIRGLVTRIGSAKKRNPRLPVNPSSNFKEEEEEDLKESTEKVQSR